METPAVETGVVVKLDRGFPLVRLGDGRELRCEHATSLVKSSDQRAVVGDVVRISLPDGHDKGIIEETLPRRTSFVRKDPTERALPQTLAANFDLVIIAQPIEDINTRRLERELVLAHETGAEVLVVLTKADLMASPAEVEEVRSHIDGFVGNGGNAAPSPTAMRHRCSALPRYLPRATKPQCLSAGRVWASRAW